MMEKIHAKYYLRINYECLFFETIFRNMDTKQKLYPLSVYLVEKIVGKRKMRANKFGMCVGKFSNVMKNHPEH